MGVAASEGPTGAAILIIPLVAMEMGVVGNGADVIVKVWIDGFVGVAVAMALVALGFLGIDAVMFAALAFVAGALNDMPEMRNDAGFDEALAALVEIDSPRIACAFGKYLEDVPGG